MKLLAKIWITLSIGILLLHGFVPHQHHEVLTEIEHFRQHEEANSFFKKIILGFHINPGDGHLEEYNPSDTQLELPDWNPILFTPLLSAIFQNLLKEEPVHQKRETIYVSTNYSISFYLSSHSLRGPPFLS